ncbi:hypothetical protein DSECCO2_131500 [anaerobic digester metagenome]
MKITKPRDKGKTAHAAKPLKYVLRQNKSKAEAGEKSDSIDAKEVLAFFAGVAIIFTLVNTFFFSPFMNIKEIVYGLTFADESITLKRSLYIPAMMSFAISVGLAVLCKEKLNLFDTKFFLWMNNHRKYSLVIIFLFILPLILANFGVFFEKINVYIVFFYILIFCFLLIMIGKCTVFGRALMFFSCFMMASWFFFAGNNAKKNNVDLPVIITLQEGDLIKALRCTISKEGFAVIKDSEQNQRIIHVSKIKEIAVDKDASLSNPAAETGNRSQ